MTQQRSSDDIRADLADMRVDPSAAKFRRLSSRLVPDIEPLLARAERVEALAAEWEADEREYLARVGQHMPCSLATVAEQVRAALGGTA